jgi:hypothetical protein
MVSQAEPNPEFPFCCGGQSAGGSTEETPLTKQRLLSRAFRLKTRRTIITRETQSRNRERSANKWCCSRRFKQRRWQSTSPFSEPESENKRDRKQSKLGQGRFQRTAPAMVAPVSLGPRVVELFQEEDSDLLTWSACGVRCAALRFAAMAGARAWAQGCCADRARHRRHIRPLATFRPFEYFFF